MVEAAEFELQQIQTANSQITTEAMDPGGPTREENGETSRSSRRQDSNRKTPRVPPTPRPKERDGKRAGVYRHRLREEDLVNLPLIPMYGADLPSGPADDSPPADSASPGQGQDTARARGSVDGQPSGPATHTYEDGDTFGTRLGPPLNREARRPPPVPPTPRPERPPAEHTYEDGMSFGMRLGPALNREARRPPPVPPTPRPERPPAEHTYEDGMSFGMRLGPALNRDDINAPPVPSTPRPGRPTGGVQQGPAGPNPLLNPQAVLDQLRPNPMYNSNQPPGPAQERHTIWGQLRHRLSRRLLICAATSAVSLATLVILVPVLLTHLNTQTAGNYGAPTASTAGPNTTGKVTFADVMKPTASPAGPSTTGSGAWKSSAASMRTSADVIKIDPGHGRGPSHGITAELEAAGPTPINMLAPTTTTTTTTTTEGMFDESDEPGAGKLHSARGVAVSPDGKIYVADLSKARLQVYSLEGAYLYQFPPNAPGLGHPSKEPSDVSIGKDGHLWVFLKGYPTSPDSVVLVDRDGHLKANFDLPDVPRGVSRGMAVDSRNNHVFVTWSNFYSGGVQAFGPNGKLLWDVGPRMSTPMNVAVDGKGNIFVSDFKTNFISTYSEAGQYVSKFGGPGLSGSRLNRPQGITVDSHGHIIVVDSDNRRLVMYTNQGTYVRHRALRTGKFAWGVAVGPGGHLVVTASDEIFVFTRY
ncbi:TRIM3 [Branchiostoma lanceolatum]|uniref:TRIM3 protein n=1 Tax=Branchiostoma lanceolatum TaxID=7740 RepID=A0A8J9YIX1_BRALA|nr:TRIM3 [Branchiostoma lanceolatum]